jgi:hypothetical protein
MSSETEQHTKRCAGPRHCMNKIPRAQSKACHFEGRMKRVRLMKGKSFSWRVYAPGRGEIAVDKEALGAFCDRQSRDYNYETRGRSRQ